MTQTTLDFLRHGEVCGGNRFRGVTDDALTEHGLWQMSQQCRGHVWQSVISSPLRRCGLFASDWAQSNRLEVLFDPNWMEIDFGDWEGKTAEQIMALQPRALQAFYADPAGFTPPNAESYAHFAARVQKAWDGLLQNHAGQHVLVVTHAGVIRALFAQLLDISPRRSFQIEVAHASLTRFSCFVDEHGGFVQLNFHKPV